MKKVKFLIASLFLFGLLQAQEPGTFNFGFNHMALSVKDVAKSAAFYKSVLQLQEITNRSKMEGIRWFALADGRELHLVSIVKENVVTNKAIHLALTTSNFDAFVLQLEKMNVPYSDWPGIKNKVNVRADGIKQVFFQDPDGYWIEVNSVSK